MDKALDRALARLVRRFGHDAIKQKLEAQLSLHTAGKPVAKKRRGAPAFAEARDMALVCLCMLIGKEKGRTIRSAAHYIFRNTEVWALTSTKGNRHHWRGLHRTMICGERPEPRLRASSETVRRILSRYRETAFAEGTPKFELMAKINFVILINAFTPLDPRGMRFSLFPATGHEITVYCSPECVEVIRKAAVKILPEIEPDALSRIQRYAAELTRVRGQNMPVE